ncbi:hypothetical protein [Deinococcus roseus]|uniref:Cyclic nucleotide-binding domain-containing protein n=1 Tax=Deinococcus roseus TaxID=392414 RepID=A0ABQ2CZG3_9DEIO|nr:hypothetical protein [Deinococcus roseus]GGJ34550.1 hypothetical protein GCM10008938_20930 [Deinococcus roseus]
MEKLIFVYNTGASLFNRLSAWSQAAFLPAKHPCKLYAMTHGLFGRDVQWRAFVSSLPYPSRFVCRDTFTRKYGSTDAPNVYVIHKGQLKLLIPRDEIDACNSTEELQGVVIKKLLT